MSFRKYEEYKESGVEWLGEVPKHWEVRRLKFCVQLTDQKIEADPEKPLPYVGLENIQSWTGKLLPLDPDVVPTSVANRFVKGLTLFGKLRPYLAKACNPDFEGLCSTELLVFKSKGFDRRLLLYLLLTDGFIKVIDSSTYGAKMPRANWDFIGNCVVPLPPLEEQKQIAAFLNKETTNIDILIDKQEQLITLLQEKRQAIIAHAVTRGLHPNVKMKDSGIEWLGEVPAHWEVRRLKFCVQLTDQKIDANREKPLPYVGLENIQSWTGKLLPIDPNVVPTSVANRFGKGMTLFGKLRPYLAKACNPDFEGLCSTELLVFKSTGFDRRLLLYLLLTDGFIKVVDSSTYGAKMPRANWDFIGNCIVPVPPLKEQKQITAFLDKEKAKIDTLIKKCETAIELLKERRTALISAAVTGKIDVRSAI